MDGAKEEKLGWFARLFRKRAKLTYWLGDDAYVAEVCYFKEVSPECVVFSDYYTKKSTMIKYHNEITYIIEQIK